MQVVFFDGVFAALLDEIDHLLDPLRSQHRCRRQIGGGQRVAVVEGLVVGLRIAIGQAPGIEQEDRARRELGRIGCVEWTRAHGDERRQRFFSGHDLVRSRPVVEGQHRCQRYPGAMRQHGAKRHRRRAAQIHDEQRVFRDTEGSQARRCKLGALDDGQPQHLRKLGWERRIPE